MKRNWYRLVVETKLDKETHDMRYLHAIKTISMFNITSGHHFWYMIPSPFSNPIFVEKVKYHLLDFICLFCVLLFCLQNYHGLIAMLMINGENLIGTIFVTWGVLSCIFIFPSIEKEKEKSYSSMIKATVFWYIRLARLMFFSYYLIPHGRLV